MDNNLTKQILNLERKTMGELKSMYAELYFEEIDTKSRNQIIRKIAYRLQELEYGFLSDKSSKKMNALANEMSKGKQFGEISYFKPINGTRICKEYRGVKYEVDYSDDGFICNGMRYKSLSALASKITGHKTNGPKFFGVNNK